MKKTAARKTAAKKAPNRPSDPPMEVTFTGTADKKLEAIIELSRAVQNLSAALNRTHETVTISNAYIHASGSEPAIRINGCMP